MEPSSGDASSQRTIHSRSEAVTAHPSTEANAESSGKGSLLGTWAHRQRIFGLLTGSPQQHQSSEHRRTDLGKEKQEVKQDQDQIEEKEYMDEAALNEQAWKWRFTRKWQVCLEMCMVFGSFAVAFTQNNITHVDGAIEWTGKGSRGG